MTTTITQCDKHIAKASAISTVFGMNIDEQFTFCMECEQNIERWADSANIYSKWSEWKVSN
jgi:hypothetical protein